MPARGDPTRSHEFSPRLRCCSPQRSHRDGTQGSDQREARTRRLPAARQPPNSVSTASELNGKPRPRAKIVAEAQPMDPDHAAPQNQGLRHAQQETADSAHDGKAPSPPENSNARD